MKSNTQYDVWRDYNYKMKQFRQHENDNFIRVPKKVRAVKVVENKQLELL
jgi:hypothetical protein